MLAASRFDRKVKILSARTRGISLSIERLLTPVEDIHDSNMAIDSGVSSFSDPKKPFFRLQLSPRV